MQTAEQLQAIAKDDPKALAKAFAASLKDFGYPVDADYCQKQIAAFLAWEKPTGGPSMFIHRWLQKGIEEA